MNVLIEGIDLPKEGEPNVVAFIRADGTVKYYKDAGIVGLMAKTHPYEWQTKARRIPENSTLRVMEAVKNGFYGTMYGQKYKPGVDVVFLATGVADIGRDGALWYVWGMPGPDYNRYDPGDYGVTWALTKEELTGGNGK